jgi:hypothetical protein
LRVWEDKLDEDYLQSVVYCDKPSFPLAHELLQMDNLDDFLRIRSHILLVLGWIDFLESLQLVLFEAKRHKLGL